MRNAPVFHRNAFERCDAKANTPNDHVAINIYGLSGARRCGLLLPSLSSELSSIEADTSKAAIAAKNLRRRPQKTKPQDALGGRVLLGEILSHLVQNADRPLLRTVFCELRFARWVSTECKLCRIHDW